MSWFSSLLGPVLGIAGNALLPGIGGVLGGALGSAIGGSSANKESVQQGQGMDAAQWIAALRANRPNQTNASGATSNWTQDDKGNWAQKTNFGPEEQKRRDLYNQLAFSRMQGAQGIDLSRYSKPLDYNAIGLGALNRAAGGQGTTGARPNYNNPYVSLGGNFLGQGG